MSAGEVGGGGVGLRAGGRLAQDLPRCSRLTSGNLGRLSYLVGVIMGGGPSRGGVGAHERALAWPQNQQLTVHTHPLSGKTGAGANSWVPQGCALCKGTL